jgi:hypothetical protein
LDEPGAISLGTLERFQAKWKPVRVKKTRQIKNLEPRFDSIETEKALVIPVCVIASVSEAIQHKIVASKTIASPYQPLWIASSFHSSQ